jgi:hypothetical protein
MTGFCAGADIKVFWFFSSEKNIFLLLLALFLCGPASAAGLACRLTATPWLGCSLAGDAAPGSPCSCPGDGGAAAGQIGGAAGEYEFSVTSESTKMALGITNLSGPVTAFVPFGLPAHRGEALTAAQQQMLQIYDFLHFRNFASGGSPVGGGAPSSSDIIAGLRGAGGGAHATRGMTPPAPPPAMSPPTSVAPLGPLAWGPPSQAGQLVPARAFLRAADIPPAGIGAYGVLAFTGRPTPASHARLVMACQSFLASLPGQADLPASIAPAQQMLTIWPIDSPPAGGADCDALLGHYDLYGGFSAIRDARTQGKTLNGRGPFLIGWSPSASRYVPDAVVLVIDMSDFETQDSFDHAFLFWQQKIVADPALWRSGFAADRIRLAIRDFADHYGSEFLHAFKIGSD